MMKKQAMVTMTAVIIGIIFSALIGCSGADSGKIPISTTSKQAREYYLTARDLSEKLRGQEALEYYQKAIEADPDFALAHLNMAFVQPSAKQFFESFDKARALADKVSDGERLWIMAVEAGNNGDPMTVRKNFQDLVAAYPDDERAHNLLGNFYFGQQQYENALVEYNKAVALNPEFSQPYNQMGYANRFLNNYADAEKAFKKYIELIPDDPNPYDSYAELLMKMGRFDESIEQYKKALTFNPGFQASHLGIACNLNFKGEYDKARETLDNFNSIAKNDGQRRVIHFAKAVSYVDEGQYDKALDEIDAQYKLAEKINDAAAMSADLITKGNILFEMGKYKQALTEFEQGVSVMEASDYSDEIKELTRLGHLFNAGRVALMENDLTTAKVKSQDYLKQATARKNTFLMWQAYQLAAMISMAEKDYNGVMANLAKSNKQNPYNIYRMSMACKGKGDMEAARQWCEKAANFNALTNLNYAFIRNKAKKELSSM